MLSLLRDYTSRVCQLQIVIDNAIPMQVESNISGMLETLQSFTMTTEPAAVLVDGYFDTTELQEAGERCLAQPTDKNMLYWILQLRNLLEGFERIKNNYKLMSRELRRIMNLAQELSNALQEQRRDLISFFSCEYPDLPVEEFIPVTIPSCEVYMQSLLEDDGWEAKPIQAYL